MAGFRRYVARGGNARSAVLYFAAQLNEPRSGMARSGVPIIRQAAGLR
jgi:hypothetical protein